MNKNESVYLSCWCGRSDPDKNGNDDVNCTTWLNNRLSRQNQKSKHMTEQNMLLFFIAYLELSLDLLHLLLLVSSHRRRTILMRDIAFSGASCRRFGSNTRLARARRFWIRPGRTGRVMGQFLFHKLLSQKNGRKISECLDHLY